MVRESHCFPYQCPEYIYIYMVPCLVFTPPPPPVWYGGFTPHLPHSPTLHPPTPPTASRGGEGYIDICIYTPLHIHTVYYICTYTYYIRIHTCVYVYIYTHTLLTYTVMTFKYVEGGPDRKATEVV